jgi:putative membrane protein
MTIRTWSATLLTLGSLAAAVGAQVPDPDVRRPVQETRDDKARDTEFVRRALEAGQQEVDFGKVASQKAANAEVRAFAARMVEDHTTANAELLSMSAPTAAPAPTSEKATAVRALESLSAQAFDVAYLARSVRDHESAVMLFEQEAADGNDERLKLWAQQKLPKLREHLDMARSLATKVSSSSQS